LGRGRVNGRGKSGGRARIEVRRQGDRKRICLERERKEAGAMERKSQEGGKERGSAVV
jgi:hypothetical protein